MLFNDYMHTSTYMYVKCGSRMGKGSGSEPQEFVELLNV
jgi:hypothetical protein